MTKLWWWGSTAALLLVTSSASAQTKVFTTNADFDAGALQDVCHGPAAFSDCADPTPDQLVLGRTFVSKAGVVWADNYYEGWIVGLDVATGKQRKRFDAALVSVNGQPTGAQPPANGNPALRCNWSNVGNCPGRVTTDTNGDVWICNRAFGQQGTISKFSGTLEHCIDRNGNGVIDTSADLDGDGIVSPANPAEYLGQNDECMITTIPIGAPNKWPRSVAVDKKGKIWTATFIDGKVYRLNPYDPVTIEAVIDLQAILGNPGVNPYSMSSGDQYVFISNAGSGGTVRIDIDTLAVDTAPCPSTYGIMTGWNSGTKPDGQVAWLGGWTSQKPGIFKADFSNHTCQEFTGDGSIVTAVSVDDDGNVWASGYNTGVLEKFASNGVHLGSYPIGGNPHGESVDFAGHIWSVAHGTPNLIYANNLDGSPASLPTTPSLTTGNDAVYVNDFYLYSDFTGKQIDRQAPYTRIGQWTGVYDGGAPGIPWSTVTWNQEAQGIVPPETKIVVSVRAADDMATLGTSGYVALANSSDPLKNVKGRYVQLKASLSGPGYVTAVLSDLTVSGPCGGAVGESCCLQSSDCMPTSACDLAVCPAPGQACVHSPKKSCCMTDADCNDGNACTTDSCPFPGATCQNAKLADCCNSNVDCDDTMPCTADICSGPGGTCSHKTITGCCTTNDDCTKGNTCSAATCPGPGMLCNYASKPGCCHADADCKSNDLCEIDVCDLATETCKPPQKVPGCCNTDADCADTDPCTIDTCSGKGGTCKHAPKPMCCTPGKAPEGMPCEVPMSPHDQLPCKAGTLKCVANMLTCDGAVGPKPDVCGKDLDCDGVVTGQNLCAAGQLCVNGYCAQPCQSGETPCVSGFQCIAGACVPTDCSQVTCTPGYTCSKGMCLPGSGGAGGGGGASAGGSSGHAGMAGANAGGTAGTSAAGAAGASGGAGGAKGGTAGAAPSGDQTTPAPEADTGSKGGCGCEVPGGRTHGSVAIAALAAAIVIARRRRSSREQEGNLR